MVIEEPYFMSFYASAEGSETLADMPGFEMEPLAVEPMPELDDEVEGDVETEPTGDAPELTEMSEGAGVGLGPLPVTGPAELEDLPAEPDLPLEEPGGGGPADLPEFPMAAVPALEDSAPPGPDELADPELGEPEELAPSDFGMTLADIQEIGQQAEADESEDEPDEPADEPDIVDPIVPEEPWPEPKLLGDEWPKRAIITSAVQIGEYYAWTYTAEWATKVKAAHGTADANDEYTLSGTEITCYNDVERVNSTVNLDAEYYGNGVMKGDLEEVGTLVLKEITTGTPVWIFPEDILTAGGVHTTEYRFALSNGVSGVCT